MKHLRFAVFTAALLAVAVPAQAQLYFGQNQVQYDKFNWKVLETDHFLVYYYPETADIIGDAARMAERSYSRLSRLLGHQFREKKPIILFRSRTDFAQNNVTGDLGEGTGGVTEALRHRVLMPFTGDFQSFEHVLAHELVHAFQYDIFARGRAGAGLQTLANVQPPLWMMEGMAEYLSLGPGHVLTQSWMRDAALNGSLPTVEQMTNFPNRFFPYRYGEALWEYIGNRWGDDVIGEILNAAPSVGVERAFKRELGLSLEELGEQWKEAMQVKHLPQIEKMQRARIVAEALLNQRKTGGIAQLFVAPSYSPDGKHIAFIGLGSYLRGEVFPDLWLADGESGKRLKRLVKSATDPDFEELRMLYSQSSFSPDNKSLAFTAQRDGRDMLFIMDVKSRKVTRTYDRIKLDVVMNPAWSPDGKQIVMSGYNSGIHDLYIVDVASGQYRQLTNDKHAEMMPQWSPDGKTIAFASDRGDGTEMDVLKFNKWRITTLDLATNQVEVLPNQAGLNLNPMWSPDGKSLAFISDRSGNANIFLYEFASKEHYQLTNLIGAVSSFAEYSPAITWAQQADKLAFTYYEAGDYTVWSISNPRKLKKEPYRATAPVVAATATPAPARPAPTATPPAAEDAMRAALATAARAADSTKEGAVSVYRSATGIRASEEIPGAAERSGGAPLSVSALLDSAEMLPDTSRFRRYDYKPGLQPEYIARPNAGYVQNSYNRGLFAGTAIVLGDMLGNNKLTLAGQINGRLSEAFFYGAYANLGNRLQYVAGAAQTPYFFISGYDENPVSNGSATYQQDFQITRYIIRQGFITALRPRNRFNRWEFGLNATNLSSSIATISRLVDYNFGLASDFQTTEVISGLSYSYLGPYAAYVKDNALFGYTAPISGTRFRFHVEPSVGQLRWTEFTADYRRYHPLLFNVLTFAYRGWAAVGVGRDELIFPKYLAIPDLLRGYDRNSYAGQFCGGINGANEACSATEMLGSRAALANAELRFPLVRRFDLGLVPISLPPVDGLFFFDAGIAWSKNQTPYLRQPANYNQDSQRYVMRSYGAGIRLNLFGFALLRWDYAIPMDRPNTKGYWMFSLGQSF